MRELPGGTVTLLFTDVEGSTKLLQELGAEEYAAALAEHRKSVRDAFAAHGGVEVDTQGDAFFVVFGDADEAVAAAAAATEKLRFGPVRVRMGLHTGTPKLTAEGYVGEDVHLGARIGAAGHGGQVLLSAATRAAIRASDRPFLADLGEHRLKDFVEPVSIFQLGSAQFPPLKTISSTNLPRPASSFVGREREVAEVVGLVRDGARLVTLSGPGGSGKTRLAVEAAAELVPEFKAGVFWVGLATLRDPTLVLETVAKTLGATDGLTGWIGERPMLLLLDNLEQVVEAAPGLADVVEACPNLCLLVTSRELLRVRGELDYPVLPLADTDAVALFAARARVEPDETVGELCRRLDNLPLALELAAARRAVLSPAQILDRLAQRLDLLRGGRDADPRQETLRTTIEWSYDLLDDDEKALFARLAVFSGGCTLETAEQVVGADVDTLQSLVDKSLVRHTGERFWMLETIREYAGEQLGDVAPRHRHAEHFLALAEAAYPNLARDAKPWLDLLDAEHDNLRAALDYYEAEGDTQRALQLGGALQRFWIMRGHLSEGRARLERAIAADTRPTAARARALNGAAALASNQADTEMVIRRSEEALALHDELGDEWGGAYAVFIRAFAASDLDDFDEASRLTEESLERFRALGDDYFARQAMMNLGYYQQYLGNHERADELLGAALEEAEGAGSEVQQARALGQLAIGARQRGRLDESLALLARSLPLWSRFGDPAMTARDLRRLARVLAHLGRAEASARVLSASEAMREAVGHWETWIGQENEEILALIKPALDPGAFERAWTEGRTLTVDDALDLALRERARQDSNLRPAD